MSNFTSWRRSFAAMRVLVLSGLVVVLTACGSSPTRPTAVAVPAHAWKAAIRDWLAHNGFTRSYRCAVVRAAAAHLPHDRTSATPIVIDVDRYEHVACSHPVTEVDAPTGTPSWLLAGARAAAVSLGDPHPTRVRVFLGRDYKLQLWGWFRCFGCSTPNNKTIITGNVATYVYRRHTRELSAFSLVPTPTMPKLRGKELDYAYAVARAAGLRVDVPPVAKIASLQVPVVRSQSPPAGLRLSGGEVVAITALGGGPIGSPAVGRDIHVRVPSFIGRPVDEAVGWVESHGLFWELDDVPPLHAGDDATYEGNFVVVAQSPSPGAVLRPGARIGKSFRPTPLVLRVRVR
jgi:PASTA domain